MSAASLRLLVLTLVLREPLIPHTLPDIVRSLTAGRLVRYISPREVGMSRPCPSLANGWLPARSSRSTPALGESR
ncbi:hypothetical protein GGTG_05008 [Gaeumannomyces tritici R3-111a-1]|uniref:Secreted protein n=1 Tax=Gaeumannomyces tritici (strain R3-111a-1) TaxID=644352 RepID=J3NUQ2_GAET3|nr:hypothetical protein GGTG_05008 [Gaeumannomyces tritici R3-111a-1]EJT79926.1 hypothetical protein GGTG_05008 [Gaeumannomyces tritici R3-111a-1]